MTKSFPRDEMFALTDQIRRSSRAIGSNIAEAGQKRRYVAHFASKLTDSDGELAETQHWIATAFACSYIREPMHDELMRRCSELGSKLGSMIAYPDTWCHGSR